MAQEPHKRYQTQFTRTGQLDMTNRKPFRTAKQKLKAKETAGMCKDGVIRSNAPVSYHKR